MEAKVCSKCKETKGQDAFSINGGGRLGRKSVCKPCTGLAERERRLKKKSLDPEGTKHSRHVKKLLVNYGLSEQDYENLLSEQGYCCAICKVGIKEYSENHPTQNYLVVDHCHKTGKIRGLLCSSCNSGLGLLGDSAESLRVAHLYLFYSEGEDIGKT
jgi:hypothetical protein